MNLKQFIEQRMQRMMMMVGATTQKLVRKEIKEMKKDLNKKLLNYLNGK